MQFSPARRDFLRAFWKFPAQKPKLFVETGFLFRNYIIPQRVAAKIYKVVLTALAEIFCPKSDKKNNGKWFFSIDRPCIRLPPWKLRKQTWRRFPVNFIKVLIMFSSNSQTCYKKKHSFQKSMWDQKFLSHMTHAVLWMPPSKFSTVWKIFAQIPKNC